MLKNVNLGALAALVFVVVAAIGGFGYLFHAINTDTTVIVRVDEPAGKGLADRPAVGVTVKSVGDGPMPIDEGDSTTVMFDWPCTKCNFDTWDDTHSAIVDANTDARMLEKDHCYELVVTGTRSSVTFNTEAFDPKDVPC